ncbi:RING-H2 finger protein ATL29-like [Chenopodium quinoa]|uniref:RING-H2 finger protein ATL29-like n=1 Tax=Chenopodium quinoa TaxID=63459 RepID=UPI000B77912D|nr:RING-H2 finger protein ATL29-like [Chenopodium quinoa]
MSTSDAPIPEPPFPQDPTPPVSLVLTILLLVMFFVGFFSIYFCRCFLENIVNSLNNRKTPSGTPINPASLTPPGLDLSIVNSFPTFTYSSVKDYRRDKYGLECAICLCEFDDDDVLRLLTTCCHVFHQECIDLWFESHKSCPVCRRNLDALDTRQSPERLPNIESTRTSIGNNNVDEIVGGNDPRDNDDAISIVIKEDDEPIDEGILFDDKGNGEVPFISEKFPRSHSTGHSIYRNRTKEDDYKYTLRLPKYIKETITNRHFVTLSCTAIGDYTSIPPRNHQVFGEISDFAQVANNV